MSTEDRLRTDRHQVLAPGNERDEWAQENLPLVGDIAELPAYLEEPQRWGACVADSEYRWFATQAEAELASSQALEANHASGRRP